MAPMPPTTDATSGLHYSEDQRAGETKGLLHADLNFDEYPSIQSLNLPLKPPPLTRSELESSTDKPGKTRPLIKLPYDQIPPKVRSRMALSNGRMSMRKPRPEPGFQEEKTGHVDGEKHEPEAPQQKDIVDKPDVNVDYEDSSSRARPNSRRAPPYPPSYSFTMTKDGYQSSPLTDSSKPGIEVIINDLDPKERKQNLEAIQPDETPQKMTEFNMPPPPADFQPKLRVRSKTRDREKAERKRLRAREREDMACEQETEEQHKCQKKAQDPPKVGHADCTPLVPYAFPTSDVRMDENLKDDEEGFDMKYFSSLWGKDDGSEPDETVVEEVADRAEREKGQVGERQKRDIVDILLAQWTLPATQ
jgi:hypothetical protein